MRKSRQSSLIAACVALLLLSAQHRSKGQQTPAYSLNVSVDEVSLTFHASDANGLPVNDLNLDELTLLDNGKPPAKILAFTSLNSLPIRAGILMDTSKSMADILGHNEAISIAYAQTVLRRETDQAFIMDFDSRSQISQPWTNDSVLLTAGIRNVAAYGNTLMGGTAIFDAVYRACQNQFGRVDHAATGNFILLFSDGEDNASHAYLKEAVDRCQRSHTAIYAFRTASTSGFSSGPKNLSELAQQTGGRVFHDEDTAAAIDQDLHIIEAEVRNQYRLVYRAADRRHNGSFHRIKLKAPKRVEDIAVRTGYYAPGS